MHCRGCGCAITDDELSYALGQADRFSLNFEDCISMVWYCDACYLALIPDRTALPLEVETTR